MTAAKITEIASIRPRHVAAAVVGNALEFYDFTIYAFFAVQIGNAFFPHHSAFVKLMLSLATFGAGFILRPIGAIVIGRFADRRGRRPAMLFSFGLMGLSILGVALTPSYAMIGPVAPFLVLLWRLCQGFALGGEVGPTTAYLVEASPPAKRGFYGAWQGGSQNLANIAGGLVGVTLATVAGAASLELWGWRAAFLLGAVILPFGLLLRRGLPETLDHPDTIDLEPGLHTIRANARTLVLGFGLVAAMTTSTYVFNFMTTYAMTTLHMAAGISLGATLVSGSCGLAGGLIGGLMSDRIGRRALMIWPRIFFILVTWPAFFLMVKNHDAVTLLGATAVMTFTSALSTAAGLVAITESLGKSVRGLGMGAIYATAVAVFGGTTQPILASLIHFTHDPVSPAWYTIGFTLIGLIASILMKESAHSLSVRPQMTLA